MLVFAISGDVFYTLSFYLKTLRTMSHFGWGVRVVVDILKNIFFGFSLFFSIFGFFENISKTWVKNWVATIVVGQSIIQQ